MWQWTEPEERTSGLEARNVWGRLGINGTGVQRPVGQDQLAQQWTLEEKRIGKLLTKYSKYG